MAELTIAKCVVIDETGARQDITVKDFMLKPINERTMLILKKRIEFYAASGAAIPPLEAVKTLTHAV